MEIDIGNLVYIAFVVLIIIVNLFTKSKKKRPGQGPEDDNPETVGPTPGSQRKTFEELLEEFTQPQKAPAPAPVPTSAPKPKPKPVSYATTTTQPVRYKQPKSQPEKQSHSMKKTDYAKFEEFKEHKTKSADFIKALRNKDAAKKAFIYSEIFNRKY